MVQKPTWLLSFVLLVGCAAAETQRLDSANAGRLRPDPDAAVLASDRPTDATALLDPPSVTARFKGKSRKVPKTSVVPEEHAPVESFTVLDDLLESLPSDAEMMDYTPPIERSGENADRVQEEERNVEVKALLYAAKIEPDNDYHLIIGDNEAGSQRSYLNCEISGLPSMGSPDYKTLKAARKAFLDAVGGELTGKSKYVKFTPPKTILIRGSLFYDIDHPPGSVGPNKMRPGTAWEIHPITQFQLIVH